MEKEKEEEVKGISRTRRNISKERTDEGNVNSLGKGKEK